VTRSTRTLHLRLTFAVTLIVLSLTITSVFADGYLQLKNRYTNTVLLDDNGKPIAAIKGIKAWSPQASGNDIAMRWKLPVWDGPENSDSYYYQVRDLRFLVPGASGNVLWTDRRGTS